MASRHGHGARCVAKRQRRPRKHVSGAQVRYNICPTYRSLVVDSPTIRRGRGRRALTVSRAICIHKMTRRRGCVPSTDRWRESRFRRWRGSVATGKSRVVGLREWSASARVRLPSSPVDTARRCILGNRCFGGWKKALRLSWSGFCAWNRRRMSRVLVGHRAGGR